MISTLKVSEDGVHCLVWDNTPYAEEMREELVNGYPDADADAQREARRWLRRQLFDLLERADDLGKQRIVKGRRVCVIRGRKIPKGTEGTVGWIGQDRWNNWKVGMETLDGDWVYVKMEYLENAEPESYQETKYSLARQACVMAKFALS